MAEREKIYIVFDGDYDSSVEAVFRRFSDAEEFVKELQAKLDKKNTSILQRPYIIEEELR